jgi:transcription antitermination factor NusG
MAEALSANTKQAPQNHLDEHEPRWFAVYTRYKREKLVNKRLQEQGIQAYLPIQQVTRRYLRKVKHLQLPLISCYVFTKITKKDYRPVLEDPDVVRFVRTAKDLLSIPEAEIDVLRRVVGEQIEVEVEPAGYQVGDDVEIIGGQLTGMKGTLVEKDGQKLFVVELETIGYALRMQVDPKYLRVTKRSGANRRRGSGEEEGWFRKIT